MTKDLNFREPGVAEASASRANGSSELTTVSRRGVLAGAFTLAACKPSVASQTVSPTDLPLKSGAVSAVGCCAMTGQLADPAFSALLTRHFSQLTPEWEMKMEYIVQDDGSYRFDAPDQIAAFARAQGMRLFGTTLVWYSQSPPAFERLDGQRDAFARAYRDYILAVAGRYRGAAGWDVVNEPVAEDGVGLRDHLWARNLGADDHMLRAFDHAAEADPAAVLFLNDYNLENIPRKRLEYMRLVERLLKRGARLGGLGTQTHLDIDMPRGAARTAIRELASFGLPIHVSELDVSFGRDRVDLRGDRDKLARQAVVAREVAEAYAELPARQRFAFTVWGLRDGDSWLRRPPHAGDGRDQPLLLDDAGRPKPAFQAVATALQR